MDQRGPAAQARPQHIWMVDSHAAIERGGAVQCASLARALCLRGHRVTCFFDRPDEPPRSEAFERLRSAGVDLRFTGLDEMASRLRFRRALREERPDLVHTHKNRALRFVYLATLGTRRPPWVANRGTVYSLHRSRFAAWIHLRRVDRMIAVSRAVRQVLLDDGMPPERVSVVYGSVDPKRFDPSVSGAALRRRWGIPAHAPVAGMLASLRTPKKGHPDLLAAAALLRERHPELRLVLAGEGDPADLREVARGLDLADRVHFPGFVEDVPEALAAFDVLVCASLRGEGLTGALREALAMERPVVTTTGAGNAELVIDGESGRLVPPGDPPRLAEAIGSLLDDPQGARAMARAGRARVLRDFTDEVRAERVEAVYRELLAERG